MKQRWIILVVFVLLVGLAASPLAQAQEENTWNLNDLVQVVANDLNRMWATEFSELHVQYRPPTAISGYVQRTRTACGRVRTQTALYCTASHSIHYELGFMNSALRGIGDFAVAAVIAHEWGHAIQAQLGLLSPSSSLENELQADCLAGAYARYANDVSQILEPGDYEEGRRLFSLIGDPEGLDADDELAHGTAAQRVASYETGFREGVDGCFD